MSVLVAISKAEFLFSYARLLTTFFMFVNISVLLGRSQITLKTTAYLACSVLLLQSVLVVFNFY